ncbi:TetR/AcrR family transcriptional regulator [Paenibacillus endoradicis]|uniref:TetR/AcrR family transcriptional regulator n=1 Tax=Paenibacillus endoradicis TaxID=2972487 RepID=UPI002158CEA0|nr:TetR/AcrR family transcriptional regulator [Paenibacillus endoradicis]MCR8656540.1 TetR/AcrR family transcriptional regulator [Paenibacillus endoradicis]
MRIRDENKVEAIFDATIQLVNEIGFAEASISKIAKRANVSAATIYIYHENKDDLLYKTYLKIKGKMSERMFQSLDETRTVKECFDFIINNYVEFILTYKDYFLFLEQIMTSPLPQKWCLDDTASLFQPVFEMFEVGKNQGLFKQEDVRMLIVYSILPIAELAKAHVQKGTQFEKRQLNAAIAMSWDAIKA